MEISGDNHVTSESTWSWSDYGRTKGTTAWGHYPDAGNNRTICKHGLEQDSSADEDDLGWRRPTDVCDDYVDGVVNDPGPGQPGFSSLGVAAVDAAPLERRPVISTVATVSGSAKVSAVVVEGRAARATRAAQESQEDENITCGSQLGHQLGHPERRTGADSAAGELEAEVESSQWTSAMKWQDSFTGEGHEPLKGKYFNDMIIAKRSGGEILQIIDEFMLEFSVVNAVTALHRIAKAEDGSSWRRDPRIKYLNRRITKMFASSKRDEIERKETGRRVPGAEWVYYIDTRSLCNAAWAFAQLSLRHDDMMDAVSEETCRKIYDCNAQQLAICAWSYAKMLRVDLQLMQTIAEEMVRRIQEFNGQHLMNAVWACAKLKFLHVELLMTIADAAQRMLDDFTPQHLSITAWGYATLGFRHLPLMNALAEEVIKTIRAFKPQNIANTAWAFATLDLRHEPLLTALVEAALPKLHSFSPQNLSNLVWSCATLRLRNEGLFMAAGEQVLERVGDFDAQGLSMLASAFAAMEVIHRPMFVAIAKAACSNVASFSARDLESIVHAFALAGFPDTDLFCAVAQQAMLKLNHFNSLDLANIAWAFATAGIRQEPLMCAVAEQVMPLISEGSFPSQALANTAWAFKVLKIEHVGMGDVISQEVMKKLDRQDLQYIIKLLALGLPCGSALAERFGQLIYNFVVALPKHRVGWWSGAYEQLVVGLKVEHLGVMGTRFLLSKLDIQRPAADFGRAAQTKVAEHFRVHGRRPLDQIVLQEWGAAFVDYDLLWSNRTRALQGCLLQKDSEELGHITPRWLNPVRILKVGSPRERSQCAEFLSLEELCGNLFNLLGDQAEAPTVTGTVRLFGSTIPCLSCVGVAVQFAQMFPGVKLEATNCTEFRSGT